MSSATTKHWTVKDVTVSVTKKSGGTAGEKLVAFLEWLAAQAPPVDPGYGQGGGGRPDQGLPGGGEHPGNRPPGSGSGGARPDNELPGQGGRPDNTLPPGASTKPPAGGSGGSGARPDQGLPGSQPGVDNSLPEFIGDNAEEIAKAVLGKCFDCKDGAQPK